MMTDSVDRRWTSVREVESIVTKRLLLRDFRLDDLAEVQAFASDPEMVTYMDWGPNTPEQTMAFLGTKIAAAAESPRSQWAFAVEHASVLIGNVELHVDDRQHRRGSMGYTIARPAWGQGFGTEAAGAVLRFGFDRLGLHKVSATCDPANIGSVRVLEKIGMRREGHLTEHMMIRGEWRDRLLYAAIDDLGLAGPDDRDEMTKSF
jgi:[ribosomal protein S5]-alanine N-acetyltransferase